MILTSPVMLASTGYRAFVTAHPKAFATYDIDRIADSPVARIIFHMVADVCDTAVEVELHAVAKLAMFFAEAESNVSPTADFLEHPKTRLRPLLIAGFQARQKRWLNLLNLIQLKHWHAKGLCNFSRRIRRAERRVRDYFSPRMIEVLDILNIQGWSTQ